MNTNHGGQGVRRRRGSIVVLAGACLIVVFAFMAFSIDYGLIVTTDAELQNAADSAALSGARALPGGRRPALTAAREWAARNSAAGVSVAVLEDEDVEIGWWDDTTYTFTPLSSSSSTSPNAVRVTCRRTGERGNALRLSFAPLIGSNTADLQRSSIAVLERDNCGLIVGIDSVDMQNGDVDSYQSEIGAYAEQYPGQNGHVCSDGSISLGSNGSIQGDARPGPGHSVSNPSKVTGSTEARTKTSDWPDVDTGGLRWSNDNDNIPDAYRGKDRSLNVSSGALVVPPGTYYFPGGMDVSGELTFIGPTTFVLGGDSKVVGSGLVNATGIPANLRIEVFGNGSLDVGGNAALIADLYAPRASVRIHGDGGFYGAVVARTLRFAGNGTAVHADESLRYSYDEYTSRSTLRH